MIASWNAWAYHHVLKLSHTIADLAGSSQIACQHLTEALQYQIILDQFKGGMVT
jgi:predicted ATPase with chaperone activity